VERKTFTGTAVIVGKVCEVTFAPKVGADGTASGLMLLTISVLQTTSPSWKDGRVQEQFTTAEAEHIIQALEALPPLKAT